MSGNMILSISAVGETAGKRFGPWDDGETIMFEEYVGAELIVPAHTVVRLLGTSTAQIQSITTATLVYLVTSDTIHFELGAIDPTGTSPSFSKLLILTGSSVSHLRLLNNNSIDVSVFVVLGGLLA